VISGSAREADFNIQSFHGVGDDTPCA